MQWPLLPQSPRTEFEAVTLTPARLVPVLGHDGLTLTQSLATIEYLEEIHPTPSLLPGDAASRARIRAIAQHIACEIHPLNNLRVLQRLESSAGTDKHARDRWYAHWVTEGFKAYFPQVGRRN